MTIHKCDICGAIVEDDSYKSVEVDIACSPKFFDICHNCMKAMGYDPARMKYSSDMVSLITHAMKIAASQGKPQTKKED